MSTTHTEGKLRFDFDANWLALKWDDEGAYIDGVRKLATTKAVDFVGLHLQSQTWLIEVKDFRGYYKDNKERFESNALATEVAAKARDTVASIVWAVGREHRARELLQLAKPMFDAIERTRVVLWMEYDRQLSPAEASAYAAEIKRQLKWLNPRVFVTSMSLGSELSVPGLSVAGVT